MGALFGALILSLSFIVYVSSLNCWMCRNGAASFDLCDQKKEKEDCQGMLRCGTFSFIPPSPANASRLYAKSCTTISLCSGNSSFCKGIGKECRVQCCDTELCNFQKGFAPTSPPLPTTSIVSTTVPSTPSTPPETAEPTTTEEPALKTTQELLNPSKDPQSGMDEEDDCSWVDAAASSLTASIIIIGMCLFFPAIIS